MQTQVNGGFFPFEVGAQNPFLILELGFEAMVAFVLLILHIRQKQGYFQFNCFFHETYPCLISGTGNG